MTEWPFSVIGTYSVEQDDDWIDEPDEIPHAFVIGEKDQRYGECFTVYISKYWGA